MGNALVNAILARSVVDPPFFSLLTTDPAAALAPYALDPAIRAEFLALDPHRLRGFVALITKVQNNGLWQWLPYTRRFLIQEGLESTIFLAYSEAHQRHRAAGPLGQDEQTRRFIAFLEIHLKRLAAEPAIRDILTHERTRWEIRTALLTGSAPAVSMERRAMAASLPVGLLGRLVPRIRGVLRVHAFDHNPLAIVDAFDRRGEFHASARSPTRLGYWGDVATGQLRILELDAATARVLSAVDGVRTIRALAAGAGPGGSPVALSKLKPFFAAACDAGLVGFESGQR